MPLVEQQLQSPTTTTVVEQKKTAAAVFFVLDLVVRPLEVPCFIIHDGIGHGRRRVRASIMR
jgi:hypothetical protein